MRVRDGRATVIGRPKGQSVSPDPHVGSTRCQPRRTISKEGFIATSPQYAPRTGTPARPVAIPISGGARWLIGAVVVSVLLYYFIGVDQGALSAFGNDMHIHEFVHDARHFLGFPCH